MAAQAARKHGILMLTWCSTDFERTTRFYRELFGWDMYPMSEWYLGFDPPAGLGGGFRKAGTVNPGDSCTVYVTVDEVEPYVRQAVELGGGADGVMEKVPGYGTYTVLTDPDGNRIAVWKSEK